VHRAAVVAARGVVELREPDQHGHDAHVDEHDAEDQRRKHYPGVAVAALVGVVLAGGLAGLVHEHRQLTGIDPIEDVIHVRRAWNQAGHMDVHPQLNGAEAAESRGRRLVLGDHRFPLERIGLDGRIPVSVGRCWQQLELNPGGYEGEEESRENADGQQQPENRHHDLEAGDAAVLRRVVEQASEHGDEGRGDERREHGLGEELRDHEQVMAVVVAGAKTTGVTVGGEASVDGLVLHAVEQRSEHTRLVVDEQGEHDTDGGDRQGYEGREELRAGGRGVGHGEPLGSDDALPDDGQYQKPKLLAP
jgi:hypothetical protein